MRVAVLGAGINGLGCAVKVKEKYPNFDVVIISDKFTPDTTGDGSGGLWKPYCSGKTPQTLITKWGMESYRLYHKLWLEGGYDVTLVPLYDLYRENKPLPERPWSNLVFGFKNLDEKHLEYLNRLHHSDFVSIKSLDDEGLMTYDVIVNCLGLGARDVVPDDKMFPVRGQLMRVHAPWLTATIYDVQNDIYMICTTDICVMGGTQQVNDYNRQLNVEDRDKIFNGCTSVVPAIKNAKLISEWVGLRPGREEIRLESEIINGKFYIHNYGHGGSGFTLFWGCASNVLEIFEEHVHREHNKQKSKL
ncbi:D-aspartate oxidase [Danaus plexippus plexippus]|uniref:D-aspartate oxidase n=1 Tax=Danaus plexippus plexippus TaxID=278856 RepID=A0A212FCN0_DANPL|nr:D-aspartate oxidase [Danaus plexippus plexippus]